MIPKLRPDDKLVNSDFAAIPTTDVYGPIHPTASWEMDGQALVGRGRSAPWSAVLSKRAGPASFRLEADVTIQSPSREALSGGDESRARPCVIEGYRFRYYAS